MKFNYGWTKKEKTIDFIFVISAGLLISYTSFFLFLQNLAIRSIFRLVLVFVLFLFFSLFLSAIKKKFSIDKISYSGIFALFILANLILTTKPDFFPPPYTITLLPVQEITLHPGSNAGSIRISVFGSERYRQLGLEQFNKNAGWHIDEDGYLSQVEGFSTDLIWIGKPGSYVVFKFLPCAECSGITVQSQNGMPQEFNLDQEDSTSAVTHQFNLPSLTYHHLINLLALEGSLLIFCGIGLISIVQFRRTLSNLMEDRFSAPSLGNVSPAIMLVIYPILVFGFKFRPVIFNDDWCQLIKPIYFNTFDFFILNSRRPMHLSIGWLFSRFFPLQTTVFAMQATYLIFLILTSIVTYYLLLNLFGEKKWLAFLGSLLWVVYPNDFTQFYLSILGIRLAYLLTLGGMLLFIQYLKKKKKSYVLLASFLNLAGLLMYEAQIGLILVWPWMVYFVMNRYESQRFHLGKIKDFLKSGFLGLLIYYASVILFGIWRLWIHPQYYDDLKFSYLKISLRKILSDYSLGLRTILGGFQLPFKDSSWITQANLLIITVLAFFCIFLFFFTKAIGKLNQSSETIEQAEIKNIRIFLAGVIGWLAGYFPIILNYPPNIWGHLSRVNIFTILGATLMVLSLFNAVLLSATRNQQSAAKYTIIVSIILILVASIIQVQVQESINLSWKETKGFYKELFQLVPNIRENTQFVVHLTGNKQTETTHRPLFSSSWEPSCAFQIFYDDPNTSVSFKYDKISVPKFPDNIALGGAMAREWFGDLDTSGNLLGIKYNQKTHKLSILENIDFLIGEELGDRYQPWVNIVPLEENIQSRELIAP